MTNTQLSLVRQAARSLKKVAATAQDSDRDPRSPGRPKAHFHNRRATGGTFSLPGGIESLSPKDKLRLTLLANSRQSMDLILSTNGATLLYSESGLAVLWQQITPAQAARLSPEAATYYGG